MRWMGVALLSLGLLVGCNSYQHAKAPKTSNKTAHRIYDQLPKLSELTTYPWPQLRMDKLLKVGMKSDIVPALRQRLVLLGDLSSRSAVSSETYDRTLAQAVRQFQWRHGLKQDGTIGAETLEALNVTPKQRLSQLVASMKKWAEFPENEGSHYIRINVPAFELDLIKDGDKVMNMRVVAGKPTRPTPTLYSKVETVVFNPNWNVPRTIVRKDVIPGMLKNPNYLAEHNIKVYSSWKKDAYEIDPKDVDWQKAHANGLQYKLTQPPGDTNPLGRVKFLFMNSHDVYMHDTPQKGLFSRMRRAFSSGCIRVEKPFQLVEYFLKDSEDWDLEKVHTSVVSGQMKYVRIKNPVPIYVTYITSWVDKNGLMHFREDVYGKAH